MTSLRNVLKASKGLPVRDPMAEIWGRRIAARNAVGEVESTLPITITADGTALLDYRVYGAEGGVGEARRSRDIISYDDFAIIDIGTGTERYGVNMGVLPVGDYEISWDSIDSATSLWLNPIVNGSPQAAIRLTTPYRFTADGMTTYILRTNKATDTPPINQLVSGLSVVKIAYDIRLKINSETVTLSLDRPLMSDEYADFGEQAAYHKSVPDDVRLRFEQENQVTFADPEAVISSGGNRVRTVVTAVLGEGYTCKEIGTVYSNTDGLCKNDDLFVYRADGLTVKKASYTDGRTARSSNTLDSGFGVKTVGFATISDGTYTTTIYTRILYASYEQLHGSGEFTAYPPNTEQNFVPTAVTLPEIPTSEGVTVIDCDMTPKPGKMYVKYRR
jgi:hypothetical protein